MKTIYFNLTGVQSPKRTFSITKIHILAIVDVIFAFYEHHPTDNHNIKHFAIILILNMIVISPYHIFKIPGPGITMPP